MNPLDRLNLYSLWRRDDGVVREVQSYGTTFSGNRCYEDVSTDVPLYDGLERFGTWERGGPIGGFRTMSLEKFRRTHTLLTPEETAWERARAVQLKLPLHARYPRFDHKGEPCGFF
jgi:hypothetical protein